MERRVDLPSTRTRPISSPTSVWSVDGSQNNLIRIPSKLSFLRKTSRERLEFMLGAATAVCLILFASLCIAIYFAAKNSTSGEAELCLTSQCLRSASNLMESMDTSADPCEDFYKYACGKWNREHFIRSTYTVNDWFIERGWLAGRDISEFLLMNDTEDEPLPVKQARTLYRSCLDTESMEEVGLKTLRDLLEDIGLPPQPPIDGEPKQPWIRTLARARKLASMDILIGFGIIPMPTNQSINKMTIATADDLFLPSRSYQGIKTRHKDLDIKNMFGKTDHEFAKLWRKYMVKFLKYFFPFKNETTDNNEEILNSITEQVIYLYLNVTEMEESENITGPLYNEVPEEMTITELQELVDSATESGVSKINWKDYFTYLYDDISNVTLDFENNYTILVYKKSYFSVLSKYLETVDENILEFTIWWQVVYTLASHINEELTDLKQLLEMKVTSVTYSRRRSSICTDTVYQLMTIAIGYQVTQQDGVDEKRKKVNEMLQIIQDVFSKLVSRLKWMDEETKAMTLGKVSSIRKFVAYPEWLTNRGQMERYYAGITINESTHLSNVLSLLREGSISQLKSIHTPHNSSFPEFDPLDINAYYNPSDNSITVPAGILQFPFYDLGLEALNYGGIGVILGHELTHGFDNTGRQYDKDGNLQKWWTNSSIDEYNNRTKCYVEEYDNYYLARVNRTVNGNLTLGENLADNGGLREALMAYNAYVYRHGEEPKLPGLQNYTHDQLFFLTYANIWCSEYTNTGLIESLKDEHSPSFVRVKIPLMNLPEFSASWKCRQGSAMNPTDRCKLWVD